MQLGISTSCYYPRTTEESLRILLDAGVKTLEVFFNSHSELEPEYLLQLRAMANEAGAKIVSVHPYTSGMEGILFFSDYDRRFADSREYYKRYYQAANILGARIVVFHGGYKHQVMAVEEYAHRIDILDTDARKAGVCLAQENVERNMSRSPGFLRQLYQLRPQQRFVFDLKQAIRAEQDPLEVLEAMGGGVVHLHLSDHLPGHDCLPPGMGETDFAPLFAQAAAQGFAGSAVIELYRKNFEDQHQLDKGLEYLKSVL
ncbi:MAG: sugar phosphate isomerase/epimerase [Oscillospiraceae bacterium]|nr:sugar phosphate isomerase/epimerase [Oscillospiraceae bacterium]